MLFTLSLCFLLNMNMVYSIRADFDLRLRRSLYIKIGTHWINIKRDFICYSCCLRTFWIWIKPIVVHKKEFSRRKMFLETHGFLSFLSSRYFTFYHRLRFLCCFPFPCWLPILFRLSFIKWDNLNLGRAPSLTISPPQFVNRMRDW